jgi:CheY-like chemotaxis protein
LEAWYFRSGGGVVGPFSTRELRRLAEAGELRPDEPVWQLCSPRGAPLGAVPAAAVLRKKRLVVLLVGPPGSPVTRLGPLVRGWGHRTRTAVPGDAPRTVRRWEPDVVLLDLDAAGVDGAELALALKEQAGPLPPAVVAVASGAGRGAEAAFRYRLEKPVDPNVLALLLALLAQERGAAVTAAVAR